MRPVPVLLYLMQPAQQRPAAQAKAAQVHAARRARRDGVYAPGRRLLHMARRLLPA